METARAHVASKESIFKLYAKSITSKYAMLFMLVLVMTFGLANYESVLGLYVTTAYMSVGNIVGPTLAGFLFDANIFAPFIAGCCILFITFLKIVRWN